MNNTNKMLLSIVLFANTFIISQSLYKGTAIIIIKTKDTIVVAADSKLSRIGASSIYSNVDTNKTKSRVTKLNENINSTWYKKLNPLLDSTTLIHDSQLIHRNYPTYNPIYYLDSLFKQRDKNILNYIPTVPDSTIFKRISPSLFKNNYLDSLLRYDYKTWSIDSLWDKGHNPIFNYKPLTLDSTIFKTISPFPETNYNLSKGYLWQNNKPVLFKPDTTLLIKSLYDSLTYIKFDINDPTVKNVLDFRPSGFLGREVPTTYCKVRFHENVGYAVAGLILHKKVYSLSDDFNIATLASDACSNLSELLTSLNSFEKDVSNSMIPIWSKINNYDLSKGGYDVQVAFFGFYDDKPFVYRYIFSPSYNFSATKKVEVNRLFTTANKVDSLEIYALGVTSKTSFEFTDKNNITGKKAINYAKTIVQFAIDNYVSVCGPPIDILVVDKLGFHWLAKKEDCD
jgi:20S proteasome alpha/beta subunit